MASNDEELATKGDLRAVESRLVERIDGVETQLTQKMDGLEFRLGASMDEKLEGMETRLLTAFETWAVPINGRVRKLEVAEGVTEERLAIIEERLRALEKRNPPAA